MGGDLGQEIGGQPLPSEYPADRWAREWATKPETAKINPRQLAGDLIARGASMDISHTSEAGGKLWKPRVTTRGEEMQTRGRRMILTSGDLDLRYSKRYGVGVLRAGLPFAVRMNNGENPLFMVPYLRFTDKGDIDGKSSEIIVLREGQVNNLLELVRGTQSSAVNQNPQKI